MSFEGLPRSGVEMLRQNAFNNASIRHPLMPRTAELARKSPSIALLIESGIEVMQYEDRRDKEAMLNRTEERKE